MLVRVPGGRQVLVQVAQVVLAVLRGRVAGHGVGTILWGLDGGIQRVKSAFATVPAICLPGRKNSIIKGYDVPSSSVR